MFFREFSRESFQEHLFYWTSPVAASDCCPCKQLFLQHFWSAPTQPAFTCSKLTVETLEQGVKYVQS